MLSLDGRNVVADPSAAFIGFWIRSCTDDGNACRYSGTCRLPWSRGNVDRLIFRVLLPDWPISDGGSELGRGYWHTQPGLFVFRPDSLALAGCKYTKRANLGPPRRKAVRVTGARG